MLRDALWHYQGQDWNRPDRRAKYDSFSEFIVSAGTAVLWTSLRKKILLSSITIKSRADQARCAITVAGTELLTHRTSKRPYPDISGKGGARLKLRRVC